jgi:hypothetical protein
MIGAGLFAGLGGAAVLGVLAHDHLADERLVGDLLYEAWLRRQALRDLDEESMRNVSRSDIVVCLTTIPSRIGRLGLTLRSLLAQSMSPDHIRLHLPERSLREGAEYDVPGWLRGMRSVRIVSCEDQGPATKLLPALSLSPHQKLLVVDDDRVFKPHLIASFHDWSAKLPDAAFGSRGWNVPEDLTDRPTTLVNDILKRPPVPLLATRIAAPTPVDILQGVGGVLVQPRFFDAAAVSDFSGAPQAARTVDDVWFAAHCRAPKRVVPIRRSNFPSYWDEGRNKQSSLGLLNRGGGDPERRPNTIMIRHFKDRWGKSA